MGRYDAIFTPMMVNKTKIKNRIVMCPMGGTSLIEHGQFDERSAAMYIERAKGGVGLIVPGIAHITDMWGRGYWLHEARDVALAPLRKTMDEIHSYDCKVFMQVGAGMGRVLSINSGMVPKNMDWVKAMRAPSHLPNVWLPNKWHREMSKQEIEEIIDSFVKTALFAQEAGVDGIEIHAIHEGYLLDQFSIESTNQRSDEYGGSTENRLRFTTEIIRRIKESCGAEYPVSVRYSVASKMKGFNAGALPGEAFEEFGRSLEKSPETARILEAAGADMLNADNGSYDSWWWAHPPMYMPMACNLPECSYIKQFVKIPVVCAGRMEDLALSLPAIEGGAIDAVGLARQLLCDPQWPNKVKAEQLDDIRPCIACHNGCFGHLFAGKGTTCALNPAAMYEEKRRVTPATAKKRVVIVGGGIGGMESARLAAIRGLEPVLLEKSGELGGVFIAAAAPDFKEADKKLLNWYKKQLADLKVDVRLNTEATPELIKSLKADEVIVATGARAKKLPVPGIEGDNVVEAIDLLLGRRECGERAVVIGGGLTGCEIAYDLAKNGKTAAVVEMLDDILQVPNLSAANSNMLRTLFEKHGVTVYTSTRLTAVTPSGVRVQQGDGTEQFIAADTVVLAVGYDGGAPLADSLPGSVHVIGDADHVGNLMDVVWAAYDTVLAF